MDSDLFEQEWELTSDNRDGRNRNGNRLELDSKVLKKAVDSHSYQDLVSPLQGWRFVRLSRSALLSTGRVLVH